MIIVQVTFLSRVIEQHEWVRMFLVFLKKKEKKMEFFVYHVLRETERGEKEKNVMKKMGKGKGQSEREILIGR